jgi:hypothetical protein
MVLAKERLEMLVQDYNITNPKPEVVVRADDWQAEDTLRGEELYLSGTLLRNEGGQYDCFQVPLGVDKNAVFLVIEHYVLSTIGFTISMVGGYYFIRCV